MDKKLKNMICEIIADGSELFFSPEGKYLVLYEKENRYQDIETGVIRVADRKSFKSLPFLDLKEEAFNFVQDNKNLYLQEFSSLFHKVRDEREAAWELLINIDNEGASDDWAEFFSYRLKKAEKLFNQWQKENF